MYKASLGLPVRSNKVVYYNCRAAGLGLVRRVGRVGRSGRSVGSVR